MVDLPAEMEQQIASMSEGDFAALIARIRAPDAAEQVREIVKAVAPARVDAYMAAANLAAFVGPDGTVDEERLRHNVRALFGIPAPPARQWGQHSGDVPKLGPGGDGRAEAQRRANRRGGGPRGDGPRSGSGGAAEARRRADRRASGAAGRAEAERRNREVGR